MHLKVMGCSLVFLSSTSKGTVCRWSDDWEGTYVPSPTSKLPVISKPLNEINLAQSEEL